MSDRHDISAEPASVSVGCRAFCAYIAARLGPGRDDVMANQKLGLGLSVDAMAFDLLADAFLDVTGVLMRIDPDATKDLLRLIQERMVALLDGTTGEETAAAALASERAVWKVRAAIRATEAV